MKTIFVGQFTAKERAQAPLYENEFDALPYPLALLPARTVKRTARARAIKEQNALRSGKF